MRRCRLAERSDLSVLDQDVVEREQELAVRGRPVVRLARGNEDVAVEAELLAVVLADVRVVPVRTGIGHMHPVGEGLTDRDRCLRVVRAVVAVLQPQTVPVDGRVEVTAVGDMHGYGRSLRNLQRRARDGAVVREHPDRGSADSLLHGDDLQLELVAVSQFDQPGPPRLGQTGGLAWKGVVQS